MLSRRTAMSSALVAAIASRNAGAAPATEVATILRVQRRSIEVNGKSASRLAVSQTDGRQGLMTAVGRQFRVRVENRLDELTLIHWRGLAPPCQQEGVPGISSPPIAPTTMISRSALAARSSCTRTRGYRSNDCLPHH